jgi:single-stranded DNA-binding protein
VTANDTTITVVGNVTADPELMYIGSAAAVARDFVYVFYVVDIRGSGRERRRGWGRATTVTLAFGSRR